MYNFAVDSEQIEDIISKFGTWSSELEEMIGNIYTKLSELNDSWSGESYDTFKAKCDEYKPALDALVLLLKAYSSLYSGNVTEAYSTLEQKLTELFGVFGG